MSPAERDVLQRAVASLSLELDELDVQVRAAMKACDLKLAAALSVQMDVVGKRIDFVRRALR